MAEQLKKCPFCGGEAFMAASTVLCEKCGAEMQAVNKVIAESMWNNRPPEWISVNEKLPENAKTDYLVTSSNGLRVGTYARKYEVEIDDGGEYDEESGSSYLPEGWYEYVDWYDRYLELDGVTHWQSLPEPPKEVQG